MKVGFEHLARGVTVAHFMYFIYIYVRCHRRAKCETINFYWRKEKFKPKSTVPHLKSSS